MEQTTATMTSAAKYEQWFVGAKTACDANSHDDDADDELGRLNAQLHEDEPEVIAVLGGFNGACVHIFRDGSVFCCCCLKELAQSEILGCGIKHQQRRNKSDAISIS